MHEDDDVPHDPASPVRGTAVPLTPVAAGGIWRRTSTSGRVVAAVAAALSVLLVVVFTQDAEQPGTSVAVDDDRAVPPAAARPQPPRPPAEPQLSAGEADLVYAATLRVQGGPFAETDAELAALGRSICASLRAGRDPEELTRSLVQGGVTAANAGLFLGAAPPALCTDQEARVDAFLTS